MSDRGTVCFDDPVSTLPGYRAHSMMFRLDAKAADTEGDWCERASVDDVTLSMHTYRIDRGGNGAPRPVIFFFNGGPGASSTPLHFHGYGPALYVGSEGEKHHFSANPDSLLDVADLVFVDPIGTGFNRLPLPGERGLPAERWLSPDGDARASAAAICAWIRQFGDAETPVYLCGQSYGGFRVASTLRYLDRVNLRGAVLVSPALDMSARADVHGNDGLFLYTFPVMAVAAQHHEITRPGLAPMVVHDATVFIARDRFATALQWGNEFGASRTRAMATELAYWTGMSIEKLMANRLRVSPDSYANELLAPRPLRIGSLDVRHTGSLEAIAGRPTNDPSLVVGRSSGRTEAYFQQCFGVGSDRPYVGLSFDVNARWNWGAADPQYRFYCNVTGEIDAIMRARPEFRLIGACGIYDMSTPAFATQHALRSGSLPEDRIEVLTLPGGHNVYEEPENRAALGRSIRALVRGN